MGLVTVAYDADRYYVTGDLRRPDADGPSNVEYEQAVRGYMRQSHPRMDVDYDSTPDRFSATARTIDAARALEQAVGATSDWASPGGGFAPFDVHLDDPDTARLMLEALEGEARRARRRGRASAADRLDRLAGRVRASAPDARPGTAA